MRVAATKTEGTEKLRAMEQITGRLNAIVAIGEEYPQLQAGENYLHLQHTVADLEEKLSAARRTYNANVMALNTAIGQFPTNLIAGVMGFKEHDMYEVEAYKKSDMDMEKLLQRS